MKRPGLGLIFCEPSGMSLILATIGALLMLFAANSGLVANGGFISDLFLGKNSPQDLVESARQTTLEISQLTLGNETLNKILFFGFWMMIGLVVYVAFSTIGHIFIETGQDIGSIHNAGARKAQLEQTILLRLAIRTASFLGLIFFGLLFIKLIFPFSILASRAWLGSLNTISGWLYGLLGLIVLVLSIHVVIVLLRFLLLRPRLLGGWSRFED
jgi:hypothetical protein